MIDLISLAQRYQVGDLKLLANHPFAFPTDDSQEIGEVQKGVPYRVCATVGLWYKPVLLELLRFGETAWDFERLGSVRSNEINAKFYSLIDRMRNSPPILDVHGVIKGRWNCEALKFLQKEGLQNSIQQRQVQSIRSVMYVNIYIFVFEIIYGFRKFLWHISINENKEDCNAHLAMFAKIRNHFRLRSGSCFCPSSNDRIKFFQNLGVLESIRTLMPMKRACCRANF